MDTLKRGTDKSFRFEGVLEYMNFIDNKRSPTIDGLVTRLHHKWTVLLLALCFLLEILHGALNGWITCKSLFNADIKVTEDYLNICFSYPFLEKDGSRRYLHFYRGFASTLFFLALLYHIFSKVPRHFENQRTKQLLEDAAKNSTVYDTKDDDFLTTVSKYMVQNMKTHDGLYWKVLFINILALLIDIFTFQYFDAVLDGHFTQYGLWAHPFQRDFQNLSDYMTQTFPPFVSCEISSQHQLVNKRIERYGCHLTNMEFIGQICLVLWIWLVLLTVVTCCNIIFLLSMWIPQVQSFYILRTAMSAPKNRTNEITKNVSRNSKIGDMYLLFCLKSHMSHVRFDELLTNLFHPKNEQVLPIGPSNQLSLKSLP